MKRHYEAIARMGTKSLDVALVAFDNNTPHVVTDLGNQLEFEQTKTPGVYNVHMDSIEQRVDLGSVRVEGNRPIPLHEASISFNFMEDPKMYRLKLVLGDIWDKYNR